MGIVSKGILFLVVATAGAAFATRPGIDEVRALFRERLAGQIADGSIMPADNGAAQALLAACQISPSQCARVLEGAVSMEYTNRYGRRCRPARRGSTLCDASPRSTG